MPVFVLTSTNAALAERVKRAFFKLVRKIPAVQAQIKKAYNDTKDDLRKDMLKVEDGEKCRTALPEKGMPMDKVEGCV